MDLLESEVGPSIGAPGPAGSLPSLAGWFLRLWLTFAAACLLPSLGIAIASGEPAPVFALAVVLPAMLAFVFVVVTVLSQAAFAAFGWLIEAGLRRLVLRAYHRGKSRHPPKGVDLEQWADADSDCPRGVAELMIDAAAGMLAGLAFGLFLALLFGATAWLVGATRDGGPGPILLFGGVVGAVFGAGGAVLGLSHGTTAQRLRAAARLGTLLKAASPRDDLE
ncbi:hypothetical protein OJF2_32280 [Aquisphaera giovannonii]|uniref:Uncharacterized protein n=1 Tax=Aquisphaera giovannonii TaxID=406548 RepID=A0A5B9W358_9BACT|nr:hypothetical protein [Aquisphaera giovannonii]QEH34687.1 hypothetical protein OJF2_32280 [Aquisphaera giovannonii]